MTPPSDDAVRTEVRAWLAEHWSPDLTVRAWWACLADSGWGYPTWPVEWFGKGLDGDLAKVVRREFEAAGAAGAPHGMGQTMGAPVLLQYGTEDQKERFLRPIATGEEAWCQFFSEPDAGSDLASLTTRAERDGDEWIVNGQKIWNSGTLTADRGVMPARTDPDLPKHKGISFFIIPVHQPGIEIRPIRQLNGEAHFNETFFTDARVRDADMVGGLNNGWAVTLATLANERQTYAAGVDYRASLSAGERGGMLDLVVGDAMVKMVEEFKAFLSFPLGDAEALIGLARENGRLKDPIIRQRIMALHAMSETAQWTAARAKAAAEAGKAPGSESSILHLAGVKIARATRDLGLEILGPGGTLLGSDAPREGAIAMMALSSLVHGIQGGSEQVQRNIMGERVLGLPKEPSVDRDLPFRETLISSRKR